MRCITIAVASLLMACAPSAQIDLKIDLQLASECMHTPGNAPPPTTCNALALGCADHFQFIVHRVDNGDDFSKCYDRTSLSAPTNLCDLVAQPKPFSLIDALPAGSQFVFELKALRIFNVSAGCDDNEASLIFAGKTAPITLDGHSQQASLELSQCYACPQMVVTPDGGFVTADMGISLPDAGVMTDAGMSTMDAATSTCGPGSQLSPYFAQGGAQCCPILDAAICPAPGSRCTDGTTALLPIGGCCAVCD